METADSEWEESNQVVKPQEVSGWQVYYLANQLCQPIQRRHWDCFRFCTYCRIEAVKGNKQRGSVESDLEEYETRSNFSRS